MANVDVKSRGDRSTTGRWILLTVVAFGLAVTGGFTYASRSNYLNQERRLTELQSTLVASALSSSPLDVERRLGTAVAVAAQSGSPASTFARSITDSLVAHGGPFSAAGLALVTTHVARDLVRVGVKPLTTVDSASAQSFYRKVAKSPVLVTGLASVGSSRRLTFGLSAAGDGGILVAYASEVLPASRHFTVARSNPESDFNLAIYFGNAVSPASLLVTDARSVPITGTVSVAHVPYGNSTLTIVSAPRTSIAGSFAQNLPWAILAAGLVLTTLVALLVDRLRRRETLAIENASTIATYANSLEGAYREQRTIAQTLQHALVPPTMPKVKGLEFAGRYLPGATGVEVGGDWYDVIPIGTGVVVSVGDVSGKGLPAASMMAALRFAIRAHATYGLSPAEILTQLAARPDYAMDGHFATVVCAYLDPVAGIGVVASAGHLPPIYESGGVAHVLNVANGPPIGLRPNQYREQTVDFSPKSMMLLYTDGLVERRGDVLDTSIAKLVVLCDGDRPLESFVDRLVKELLSDTHHDDVAVLAVGRTS